MREDGLTVPCPESHRMGPSDLILLTCIKSNEVSNRLHNQLHPPTFNDVIQPWLPCCNLTILLVIDGGSRSCKYMLSPIPITADYLLRLQRPIVSIGDRKILMLLEVRSGKGPALWMEILMLWEVLVGEGLAQWMGISVLAEVLAGEGLALWREGLD